MRNQTSPSLLQQRQTISPRARCSGDNEGCGRYGLNRSHLGRARPAAMGTNARRVGAEPGFAEEGDSLGWGRRVLPQTRCMGEVAPGAASAPAGGSSSGQRPLGTAKKDQPALCFAVPCPVVGADGDQSALEM